MPVMKRTALLLLFMTSCASASHLRDTQTIHDAEAKRIWVIRDSESGPSVVACDMTWRPLCAMWTPNVSDANTTRPAAP